MTTLPREQLIRPGHVRISARLQVIAIDDPVARARNTFWSVSISTSAQRDQALRYNTEVAGLWRLKPLTSQANPGGYPDQARWASQGVDGAATAVGPLSSTRLDNPIAGFRSRIIARLAERSGEGWAAMRALVLGDSRALDSHMWQDLRHLGIVHVLVISGLHIGLLASICLSCFCLPRRFLQMPGDQGGIRYACAGTLLVTGAYVLSGRRQSAGRACLPHADRSPSSLDAGVVCQRAALPVVGTHCPLALGPKGAAGRQFLAQCGRDLAVGECPVATSGSREAILAANEDGVADGARHACSGFPRRAFWA